MRKLYLFFLIIFFIIGISTTNDAYVEMTGKDSHLLPQCRRIDSEIVAVIGLGHTAFVNTADISIKINKTNYQLTAYTKNLINDIKTKLGMQTQEQETQEAYGIQIL